MSTLSDDNAPVVIRDRGVLGGRPTFRGTRVQAEILFENLANGYSIDEIIYNFPTLDRGDVQAALLQACEALKLNAPDINPVREDEPSRARVPG